MARPRARRETSAGGVVFRRSAEGPVFLLILDSHGNWGFPKGHIEGVEKPLQAACREIAEETGVTRLEDRGDLDRIDWYFRVRGGVVHKFCHLFLFETSAADVRPQLEEGITECGWHPLDSALRLVGYENARAVLRRAGEHVQVLTEAEAVTPDR